MALATKDLRLAVDLARAAGVPAELSAVVEQLFARARAAFGDDAGEMTPVRLYEETAGIRLRLPEPTGAGGLTARAGEPACARGAAAASRRVPRASLARGRAR